ncbi:FadR/GntR family transcriptional regulator [Saccharopolyspora karakumensis]|nr:FCD domain-containing protein [Saccharopolyspora karakumensis]
MKRESLLASKPVRTAYQQVYDAIRDAVLSGQLAREERLPPETEIAEQFGVGRATVREALRLLAADGLIRTTKGTGGGSYVTLPTVDHLTGYLERNFELLRLTKDVAFQEFVDARLLIEGYAARQAAASRTKDDLNRLRSALVTPSESDSVHEVRQCNANFHSVLIDACGNSLLRPSARAIFAVMSNQLGEAVLPEKQAAREHQHIFTAIEAGDPEQAEELMRTHIQSLTDAYKKVWDAD